MNKNIEDKKIQVSLFGKDGKIWEEEGAGGAVREGEKEAEEER